MTEVDITAVVEAVARRYGSVSERDYSFVIEALAARPYADLVHRLATLVDIEETTDPNDDVSFRYVVTQEGDAWYMSLSMVGPYGLLLRLSDRGAHEVIADLASAESDREAEILALLEHAGIHLLSREAAEQPITLRRPGADEDEARIYHAVISDEPLLPWQADS